MKDRKIILKWINENGNVRNLLEENHMLVPQCQFPRKDSLVENNSTEANYNIIEIKLLQNK